MGKAHDLGSRGALDGGELFLFGILIVREQSRLKFDEIAVGCNPVDVVAASQVLGDPAVGNGFRRGCRDITVIIHAETAGSSDNVIVQTDVLLELRVGSVALRPETASQPEFGRATLISPKNILDDETLFEGKSAINGS